MRSLSNPLASGTCASQMGTNQGTSVWHEAQGQHCSASRQDEDAARASSAAHLQCYRQGLAAAHPHPVAHSVRLDGLQSWDGRMHKRVRCAARSRVLFAVKLGCAMRAGVGRPAWQCSRPRGWQRGCTLRAACPAQALTQPSLLSQAPASLHPSHLESLEEEQGLDVCVACGVALHHCLQVSYRRLNQGGVVLPVRGWVGGRAGVAD